METFEGIYYASGEKAYPREPLFQEIAFTFEADDRAALLRWRCGCGEGRYTVTRGLAPNGSLGTFAGLLGAALSQALSGCTMHEGVAGFVDVARFGEEETA